MYCCINGCGNKSAYNRHKLAGIQFYSFPAYSSFLPWQNEKRKLWIDAVRRHTCGKCSLHAKQLRKRKNAPCRSKNPDTFKPTRNTRVCSAHFVGNKKSENPHNPAYIPKIFAGIENAKNAQKMRLYRQRLREKKIANKSNNASPPAIRQRALTGAERSKLWYHRKKLREINLLHPNQQSSESQESESIIKNSDLRNTENTAMTSDNEAGGATTSTTTSPPPAPHQPPCAPPAASLPEKPKLTEDVPTFSMLPALQVVPIEPFVPEEVDNSCKDCAAVTVKFSFWCVQCCRGPLCGACAECAPHDGHYLLRTPTGATHSQTEAVLAVIRQHLQAENLLTLYEIDNNCVKVEIKEEPEELPPFVPEPATEPDALNPLATHYSATGRQFDEGETIHHYLPKRRRIMPTENNATQLKTLVKLQAKTFISQTNVKDTPSGFKTVLKRTPSGLKKVLLKPISSGSQSVLKLKPIPSDSILKTKLDGIKRSQNVPKAISKTRKSQTVLKIIPHDPKRKTLLQVTPRETLIVKNQPSDIKEPQTKNQPGKLKIKRTLLKVPLSELAKVTKSKTLLNHPSGSKTLRKVKPGEILELDEIQKILKGTAVQQNDPTGRKLHNVLKGFSIPLKVTSEPSRNSETFRR